TVQQQINLKEDKSALGTMAYQNADNVNITGGALKNVAISDSKITIKAGESGTSIKLHGTLNV
ncbi:MAG: hypothetical protein GWN00_15605, partial [Aliifodinibius sp.]|nr:hypothetical protein [Fodinibius sp.]NIV12489.1 hypothetical protein [Fodinibius sp.]NIY26177.1 hypothetical protein [Fodinibius sp.]